MGLMNGFDERVQLTGSTNAADVFIPIALSHFKQPVAFLSPQFPHCIPGRPFNPLSPSYSLPSYLCSISFCFSILSFSFGFRFFHPPFLPSSFPRRRFSTFSTYLEARQMPMFGSNKCPSSVGDSFEDEEPICHLHCYCYPFIKRCYSLVLTCQK